ncbi:hypothetical protein CU044_4721 [Streptomyces sp. L-9-10]|nr:hypothetical protein CU044_4721 [Streptomyces sp. L-9-10]
MSTRPVCHPGRGSGGSPGGCSRTPLSRTLQVPSPRGARRPSS